MRKLILQEFVSLDGLASGPGDNVDYVPRATENDDGFNREQLKLVDTIDTILLGRVTYQLFVDYWPTVTEGEDKELAERLNTIPKVVFSNSLTRAPWGAWKEARVVAGSATDEIARLKRQPGKNLVVWGSLALAQSLMKADLIDEYLLVVCPVVLGGGRPLFGGGVPPADMTLMGSRVYDRGEVMLTYRRTGPGA